MKRPLFLLILLAVALSACTQPLIFSGMASRTNSGTQTTLIYPLKANGDTVIYNQNGIAAYAMTGDAISGTTAGILILQGCLTAEFGKWYSLDTLVVTGSAQSSTGVKLYDPMPYRRVRAIWATQGGPQSTKGTLIHNWMSSVSN